MWTTAQDKFLRKCLDEGMPTVLIAEAFAEKARFDGGFVPRSRGSIDSRVSYLGWSLQDAYWTMTEVSRIFGVHVAVVAYWCNQGLLKAVTAKAQTWNRILKKEVKHFVEKWAGILFDPSLITEQSLQVAARAGARKNARRPTDG